MKFSMIVVDDSEQGFCVVCQSDYKEFLEELFNFFLRSGKHRTEIAIVKTENLSHYMEADHVR